MKVKAVSALASKRGLRRKNQRTSPALSPLPSSDKPVFTHARIWFSDVLIILSLALPDHIILGERRRNT